MNIAELFVNIGIKGATKVGEALSSVTKGLGDVSSQGLAAKAAVVGVIYGLEHFMSQSAEMGMGLKQFAALTGISTTELQKWQYAARQSGVQAEEVASSMKGIQSAIARIQMGQGPSGGFAPIAAYTGKFEYDKINNTLYVLKKIKEFAKSDKVPIQFANEWMKQAGLSENMIQFLRTTQVDLEKIKPSNIFSTGEIARLSQIQVAWENLHRTMEMQIGHFTSKYGMDIVTGLSNSLKVVIDTTENIIKLNKEFGALKYIAATLGVVLAASFAPVTTAIAAIVLGLSEIEKFREKKDLLFGTFKYDKGKEEYTGGNDFGKFLFDLWRKMPAEESDAFAGITQPKPVMNQGNTVTNTITQNITHHGDAKDTQAVKDTHRAAAFYRTKAAQVHVN